jgi:autotransporter translocation and assembly factor TamB
MAVTGQPDTLGASGRITIESGLIRVPERPPSLLPTSGEVLLPPKPGLSRSVADTTAQAAGADTTRKAAPDTTAGPSPAGLAAQPAPRDTTVRKPLLPSVAIRVDIPGGLWLRGRGLNVELMGDLTVGVRNGLPIVAGELKGRQGSLKLLGNYFTLERGAVDFYGRPGVVNPDLDIRLTTRQKGITYIIEVFGSVQDPSIELSSDPAMDDADIVSSLLFGRTLDQLEEGQVDMVADRAAQIALAYGTTQLQDSIETNQNLIDIISIEPSQRDSAASSLIVGKYLSPEVLVRYEQVMDEQAAWYVHLNYLISNLVRLHGVISDGQESGAEIMWYWEP